MVQLMTRADWTSHGPARPLTALEASQVVGMSIHWPGTTGPIGDPGARRIAGRLEGYRAFHTDPEPVGRGWSDIAYNLAADQAGRIWPLRGTAWRSAANGDQATNQRYVAVLALVGPGEQPTPALCEALRVIRREHILTRYPGARNVVGHRDVRPDPTDCPGDILERLIKAGTFVGPTAVPAPAGHEARPFELRRLLRFGCTGRDVEQLQKRLNQLLDRDVRVDGDFGPDTRAAVVTLQRAHDLTADGVVGKWTCGVLHWVWKP